MKSHNSKESTYVLKFIHILMTISNSILSGKCNVILLSTLNGINFDLAYKKKCNAYKEHYQTLYLDFHELNMALTCNVFFEFREKYFGGYLYDYKAIKSMCKYLSDSNSTIHEEIKRLKNTFIMQEACE